MIAQQYNYLILLTRKYALRKLALMLSWMRLLLLSLLSTNWLHSDHQLKISMEHQTTLLKKIKKPNFTKCAINVPKKEWPELFLVTRKISEFKLKKFRWLCSLLMSCYHNVPLNAERNKPPNRRKLNHANYLRKTRESKYTIETLSSRLLFFLCVFFSRLANVLPLLSLSLCRSQSFAHFLFSVILCCIFRMRFSLEMILRKQMLNLCIELPVENVKRYFMHTTNLAFTLLNPTEKVLRQKNSNNINCNEKRKLLSFISFFVRDDFFVVIFVVVAANNFSAATHNQRIHFFLCHWMCLLSGKKCGVCVCVWSSISCFASDACAYI